MQYSSNIYSIWLADSFTAARYNIVVGGGRRDRQASSGLCTDWPEYSALPQGAGADPGEAGREDRLQPPAVTAGGNGCRRAHRGYFAGSLGGAGSAAGAAAGNAGLISYPMQIEPEAIKNHKTP